MFSDHVLEDHNEGTEAHEVEKSFLLMSRESDYVTNLQKALHRKFILVPMVSVKFIKMIQKSVNVPIRP
ncbi:MAG: hypothetical protein CM1200mP31_6090 [Candidatus Neomarinimicrobiota bacterium]|nr:MAG: hypothetical protein CM1200mP31_6090 [Candidatus Neomarinimicrobiota bacterium]